MAEKFLSYIEKYFDFGLFFGLIIGCFHEKSNSDERVAMGDYTQKII